MRLLQGSLTGAIKKHAMELRFIVVFATVAGAMCAAYCTPWTRSGTVGHLFRDYLAGYTRLVGCAVALFDGTSHVLGQDIVGRFGMEVVRECDGAEASILYTAAVIAFPASMAQRAVGLVAGYAGITVVNVARLCVLYLVGVHAPSSFEFAHELSGPLIVTATLSGFLLWIGWTRRKEARRVDAL
jgi:exosortase/archaeosortase family protein